MVGSAWPRKGDGWPEGRAAGGSPSTSMGGHAGESARQSTGAGSISGSEVLGSVGADAVGADAVGAGAVVGVAGGGASEGSQATMASSRRSAAVVNPHRRRAG